MTALYALTLRADAGRDATLGTVRLRWTEPDAKRESKLDRPIRASDLAGRFEETGPTFKLDAIVAASAEAIHGGRTGASGLGGILDVGSPRLARPAADRRGPRVPGLPRSDRELDG